MVHADGDDHPVDARAAAAGSSNIPEQYAIAARLLLIAPMTVGCLLAEAVFAVDDRAGAISLAAGVSAWLLAWIGVAWALRTWVAALVTFVPAIMIVLGAAMIGDVATVTGIILLCVGATLLLAIVWSRVSAPDRRWTPGWSAPGGTGDDPDDSGISLKGWPDDDLSGTAGLGTDAYRSDSRELDPDATGAKQSAARPQALRTAPPWDTSATDMTARDALVLGTCRRGGTTGPTLVTLEEFFTGNGDSRSIAPELRGAVPLKRFAELLRRVRDHSDVAEVLVQLDPLEPGEYPAGEWPRAGSVHLVAALDADELDEMLVTLRGEPVLGPLPTATLANGAPAPQDMAEFALFWA